MAYHRAICEHLVIPTIFVDNVVKPGSNIGLVARLTTYRLMVSYTMLTIIARIATQSVPKIARISNLHHGSIVLVMTHLALCFKTLPAVEGPEWLRVVGFRVKILGHFNNVPEVIDTDHTCK